MTARQPDAAPESPADVEDPPAPDSAAFRSVMARFATGVTVMTAMDADGEVTGMTANAVASVSLEPLLVLVCVERTTDMSRRLRSGGCFAVSMLTAEQRPLSDHFANPDRSRGWAGFEGVAVRTEVTGAPVLEHALGWLDCRVHAIHDGGDHLIVVGRVVAAGLGDAGPALGYFRHGYVEIDPPG